MADEHDHGHHSHHSLENDTALMNASDFNDHYHDHSMDHNHDHSMDHNHDHSMDHNHDHSTEHDSMHGDHGHASSHADHADHQGHMMYFHSSTHSTILFSFWQTNSVLTMLISCMAIIILGAMYEGLKTLREKLLLRNGCCDNKMCGPPQIPTVASSSFGDGAGGNGGNGGEGDSNCCSKGEPFLQRSSKVSLRQSMWNKSHLLQSLLHGLQIIISYFLMLIFMTYNVWPCSAVVIGAMLGYFLFSWRRHKCSGCMPASQFVIGDHCH